MSLQACKQAGCEIVSACKGASFQQSRRVPAHSRALQQEPCWGTRSCSAFHDPRTPETETCALISATSKHPPAHVCTVLPRNLSQLWAQKHRDCSMSLELVQNPTVFHAVTPNPQVPERGKRSLMILWEESVLNNLVRTNGSSKGRHSSCSALAQGFLSSCLGTKLACLLSDAAFWTPA